MKASTMDYYISGPEFKFYAKPYYLRLTFPHMLAEGGNEKTQYDVDKGELTIILKKLVAGKLQRYNTFSSFIPVGQFFENLDMITELLGNKNRTKPPASAPKIEVLQSGIANNNTSHGPSDLLSLLYSRG